MDDNLYRCWDLVSCSNILCSLGSISVGVLAGIVLPAYTADLFSKESILVESQILNGWHSVLSFYVPSYYSSWLEALKSCVLPDMCFALVYKRAALFSSLLLRFCQCLFLQGIQFIAILLP